MRKTIDVTIEVVIDRPAESVFAVLGDAERISEWVSELVETHAEPLGAAGPGAVVRYVLDGGRSGTWATTEWDPPRRIAWDGPALAWAGGGMRPRGSHDLIDLGDGTTRLVTRYQPELSGTLVLLSPYLSRWLRRQRTADARVLKHLVESE